MGVLVEAVIDSLRVSLTNSQRVLILHAKKDGRYLPIWIGPYEAEAITIMLQEVEVSRPLTHDLLKEVFSTLHGRLQEVQVYQLKNDVFYARIMVEQDGNVLSIDSRPSDAIALAIRAHIPILVDTDVLAQAGIHPEPDKLQDAMETQENQANEPGTLEKDDSLSIFEDFLKKLDKGTGSNAPDDDPEKS